MKKKVTENVGKIFKSLIISIFICCSLVSCKDYPKFDGYGNVMLLYSAGYNSLSPYLQQDIEEISSNFVPWDLPGRTVLLIFSRQTKKYGDYTTPSAPLLMRVYKNDKDKIVRDTLDVSWLDENTMASDASTINKVLTYIRDEYPSDSYGMIMSSHASGWLPSGYFASPSKWEDSHSKATISGKNFSNRRYTVSEPYAEPTPGTLMTKSFGEDRNGKDSYQVEIKDLAAAIPYKLDYILFDACLMGCVEVAYQFRNVCEKMAFSQAEVLADGFNYKTIAESLIGGSDPDLEGVCKDFYEYYNAKSGDEKSATISMVYPGKMDDLASVCKTLFAKYRTKINSLDGNYVQVFCGGNRNFFYDLEDILAKAGATDSELSELKSALSKCVGYTGCTGQYYSAIDAKSHKVTAFSGFTMYLPSEGTDNLNECYKVYDWNSATELVK